MSEEGLDPEVQELVDDLLDRFENTEMHALTLSSRSAMGEEADRYEHNIDHCFEKNIPNFESLTLGFSRRFELELVNFNDAARGIMKYLREQLVQKLPNYDDDAVAEFTNRAVKIINDESETLREDIRSSFMELSDEKKSAIVKAVQEFDDMTKLNDNKRRLRVTAMLSPYTPENDGQEKKSLSGELDRKTEEFTKLFKTLSDSFTDVLTTNTKLSKLIIDHCIQNEMSLFMSVLSNFNDEMYRIFKNQKLLVNSSLEQALEQLYKICQDRDDFYIAAHSLEQKAKFFFEGIERQLDVAIAHLDKYRDEERRKVICINRSTRLPLEEDLVYAVTVGDDILFDGRIRRRANAAREINLKGVELHMDEKYIVTCELHKTVLLKRINDESEDFETFTVQNYQHTNLLRCLGTGWQDRSRYLVFEHFPKTLFTALSEKPMDQDEFIQFTQGLQQALQYLHENNRFHGDLRPENVFFEEQEDDDYAKVKLADFSMMSARGTVEMESAEPSPFSAPEAGPIVSLFLLQKSDIWSFGTLIWYALTGVTPADEKIADLPSAIPDNSSMPAVGDLLKKCWSANVENRPNVFELNVQCSQGVIADIAFTFDDDAQWTEELEKWKAAAKKVEAAESE